MLATTNRMYTELCRVMDIVNGQGALIEHLANKQNKDYEELAGRINYTLERLLEVIDRINALESKKATKKVKAKKK